MNRVQFQPRAMAKIWRCGGIYVVSAWCARGFVAMLLTLALASPPAKKMSPPGSTPQKGLFPELRSFPPPLPSAGAASCGEGQIKVSPLSAACCMVEGRPRASAWMHALRGGGKASPTRGSKARAAAAAAAQAAKGGQGGGGGASMSTNMMMDDVEQEIAAQSTGGGSIPSVGALDDEELEGLEEFKRKIDNDEADLESNKEIEDSGPLQMSEGESDAMEAYEEEEIETDERGRKKMPSIDRLAREAVVNRTEIREIEDDLKRIREEREEEEEALNELNEDDVKLDKLAADLDAYIKKRTRINASGWPEVIPINETSEGAGLSDIDLRGIVEALYARGQDKEAEELMREQKKLEAMHNRHLEQQEQDVELIKRLEGRPLPIDDEVEDALNEYYGPTRLDALAYHQYSAAWPVKKRILDKNLIEEHPLEVDLWSAVVEGNASMARDLIQAGANCTFGDPFTGNWTAMHYAACAGYSACVKQVVKGGGDVNAAAPLTGLTPLHEAARGGHVGAVRRLIHYGANPNARCKAGLLPLEYAYAGSVMMPDGRVRPRDSIFQVARKRFLQQRAARTDGFDTDGVEEEDDGSSKRLKGRVSHAGVSGDGEEGNEGEMIEEGFDILTEEVENKIKVGDHKEVIHFLTVECKVQGDIKPSDYARLLDDDTDSDSAGDEDVIDKVFGRGSGGKSQRREANGEEEEEEEEADDEQEEMDAVVQHELAETRRLVAAAEASMDRIWDEEAGLANDYSLRKFGLPLSKEIMEQVKSEMQHKIGIELEGAEQQHHG